MSMKLGSIELLQLDTITNFSTTDSKNDQPSDTNATMLYGKHNALHLVDANSLITKYLHASPSEDTWHLLR